MAICNLFKPLKKETGTFLMFSQYTEDLTKMYTQPDQYRVEPAAFMAMEFDFSKNIPNDILGSDGRGVWDNSTIPLLFQNYYENTCAALKNDTTFKWEPEVSKTIFWNCLYDSKLITEDLDNSGVNIINESRYVGEVNIQSYSEYNNLGYDEIYCYIPADGKEQRVKCTISDQYAPQSISDGSDGLEGWTKEQIEKIWGDTIMVLPNNIMTSNKVTLESENKFEVKPLDEQKEFKFNAIILFYNIKSAYKVYDENDASTTEQTIYYNIPLGIYFPGVINNHEMTNTITKYVTNENIYGAGTSYGVRICNRFITSAMSENSVTYPYNPEDSTDLSSITELLSEMAKTMNKMNDVIENQNQNMVFIKESLSTIKNNQVNIPYIKTIGDKSYWFVNGKNTYVVADVAPYSNSYIEDQIEKWENDPDIFN